MQRTISKKEYPHVTEAEARAIWSTARKPSVRMLIRLLWFTGLRITEALSLCPKDLITDLKGDFSLMVWREKHRGRDKKPDELPIIKELGYDLKDYINSQNISPQAKLFNLHRTTAWRQVQQCAKEAGLHNWKDIHPHSFRHGFIYDKVQKGVPLSYISSLSGHNSINTTMIYIHPTKEDLRKAIEK